MSEEQKEQQDPELKFSYSLNLLDWFRNNNCGIICSSYKTHMVYSLGLVTDPTDNMEKFSIWFNSFNRPTALAIKDNKAWLATQANIWQFSNINSLNDLDDGFDCTFSPKLLHCTNNIDAHDFVINKDGKLLFINTKFSCISSLDNTYNFNVEYVPPWITKVAPEDRCHLNGLCLDNDDNLRYITAVCDSDVQDGWRNRRKEEDGFIYDIIEDKVVCANLTMPHCPRLYNNKLWVLNSGKGEFGYVEDNKFVSIAFIPGFLRGLDFIGKYAVIGSSLDRHEGRFSDLMLGGILKEKKVDARCGVFIIDITNGFIVNNVEFDNVIEMYDVKIVKNVRRPRMVDMDHDLRNVNYRLKKN